MNKYQIKNLMMYQILCKYFEIVKVKINKTRIKIQIKIILIFFKILNK